MKPRTPADRYVVTLVAMPGDVAPLVRLRAALKVLNRRFKLRCLQVVETTK